MIGNGDVLTLDIEKPAAGGRMLARHHGQVVLVSGAIPGERVAARVERTSKHLAFATTLDVLSPSPDRRAVSGDPRCGGNVLAHVAYERQRQLKAEIILDAFARIGRVPIDRAPEVIASPERGYRMRARLHARNSRLGFYREESHDLCDAIQTGQLIESTNAWIVAAQDVLQATSLHGVVGVEIAENIAGDERACHLELRAGVDPAPYAALSEGLIGLSAQPADWLEAATLAGTPRVVDVVQPRPGVGHPTLRLARDVRAFFQGNRFLVETLLHRVMALVSRGPVVDLYAGGGLFGLALLSAGMEDVTLVEGDLVSSADLQANAGPYRPRARVERASVETFLATRRSERAATMIVDPPRTGLSRDAVAGIIAMTPATLVYVSCDVATLARDTRALLDGGYTLGPMLALDLFPNTAHVETVVQFNRSSEKPRGRES
jgi:tRNA/tmRNA/rRNA uracil-C5-methylase (TrmA/RlmC/RlmD family)